MSIQHIIVHRLEKEREALSALHPRDKVLEVSTAAENLLANLRATYEEKTGKAFGVFQQDQTAYPFSAYLGEHLDGAVDFAEFSRRSMERLRTEIDKEKWATGGYVAFILYRTEGEEAKRYLLVVMLNDRRGTAVDPATLEIRDVTHLMLDELHLAGRIDIDAWRANEKSYLTFVKGRKKGTTVSRYFREFLGCTDYVDSVVESRKLARAVQSYTKREKLSSDRAKEIRADVFDKAARAVDQEEPLDLELLSEQIDPDEPHKFLEYANSDKVRLTASFDPDLASLRRLARYSGRDAEVSVSFEASVLGNRVQYDKKTKSLTIVRLPKRLERELDRAV